MPTPTYIPLAEVTLAASASAVFFANISQTYSDLVLTFLGSGTSNANLSVRFNGDAAGNYDFISGYGNGSSTGSSINTNATGIRIASAAFLSASAQLQVQAIFTDFSATDKYKSVLSRADSVASGQAVEMVAGKWANTSAITSMSLFPNAGEFAAGSTFKLFGIHGEVA